MKKCIMLFTALFAIALTANLFAQGGTTGGSGGTGTPSRTGGTTTTKTTTTTTTTSGNRPGSTGGGGSTGGSGSGGVGSGGAGSTGTPTADPTTMVPLKASELMCCSSIYYRNAKASEMIVVAENPFQGKFEGHKVSFQLTGKDGKVVPSTKYKLAKDSDG
ncbi:MAG: hypothetical protein ABIO44_00865, partial [Saprospiraceae bacterium]